MPIETIIEIDEIPLCIKLSSSEIANIYFAVCTHLTDKLATININGNEASDSYLKWCFPYIKRLLKAEYELIMILINSSERTEKFDLLTQMSVLRYFRSLNEDLVDTVKYDFPIDESVYASICIDRNFHVCI